MAGDYHRDQARDLALRGQGRAERLARRRRRSRRRAGFTAVAVLAIGAGGGYALLDKAGATNHPAAALHRPGRQQPRASVAPSAGLHAHPAVITVTWAGDMTFGRPGSYPPGGAAALIGAVTEHLHSDLTIGNLETALGSEPLTKCARHETDCYAYEAPADTAGALRHAGFSAVNVANNHTMDAGPAGEQSTDAALTAGGLRWAGRPGQITYLRRGGIRIALLGFAPWPYDASLLDLPAASALVGQARRHARVVIVMIHAGGEGAAYQHVRPGEEYYLGEDRGNSIAFAHAVIDAGADLVLGSGPHVLRAMQWYHGHLIAYSLGNFCGYYTLGLDGVTADSAILHVTLAADGSFVRGSITPIVLTGPGMPSRDSARTAVGLINTLSADDFAGDGAVRIRATGRIERPAA
jgi:poly-gamma-glutamate capsule biosynthesis protein CapA/YwtB (metallophosphatase superfamily)